MSFERVWKSLEGAWTSFEGAWKSLEGVRTSFEGVCAWIMVQCNKNIIGYSNGKSEDINMLMQLKNPTNEQPKFFIIWK